MSRPLAVNSLLISGQNLTSVSGRLYLDGNQAASRPTLIVNDSSTYVDVYSLGLEIHDLIILSIIGGEALTYLLPDYTTNNVPVGAKVTIKGTEAYDEYGITISPELGYVDGVTDLYVSGAPYLSLSLVFDGTNWWTI